MTFVANLSALTGLRVEADMLAAMSPCKNLNIICAASDPGRARLLFAQHLAATRASHLLSFGLAGGLAPELPAGSMIIADRVFADGATYRCDAAWIKQLATALPQARVGGVQGVTTIAATAADKRTCYQQHQALVCDMESPIVAEAAMAAGVPFACLRVVCDPAEFALPPAALLPLREDGAPHLPALLRSLLAAPGQIPVLLALRRHYRAALQALERAARAVV